MKKYKLCQCFADGANNLTDRHKMEKGNLIDGYKLKEKAWFIGDDNFSGEISYVTFEATEMIKEKEKKVSQKAFFKFCPFCSKQMFEEVDEQHG